MGKKSERRERRTAAAKERDAAAAALRRREEARLREEALAQEEARRAAMEARVQAAGEARQERQAPPFLPAQRRSGMPRALLAMALLGLGSLPRDPGEG